LARSTYLFAAALLLVSCAHAPPPGDTAVRLDASDLDELYPAVLESGRLLEISASVRIDLPRYRVRGTCGILWDGNGGLRIDFVHSSLFGSYREEATILVSEEGSITIIDHERETVRGDRESLALLGESLGIRVFPQDIAAVLLLSPPGPSALSAVSGRSGEDGWRLEGGWLGRGLIVEGEPGKGPSLMEICGEARKVCYTAEYGWGTDDGRVYPERLVIRRTGGAERLAMEVESVERHEAAGGPAGE